MLGRGSPRFTMLLSKVTQKKNSPKVGPSKKHGGSPREKTRAAWNPILEKTLVDLLHEHNTPDYRGQNGWTPEAWNKIVKEFQERESYVDFTKVQIQEKEKELKREYKMLKEARKQSGVSWDKKRCMIQAEPPIWDNIIRSFPKSKKFRNKSFPQFEALGELYDGHTAEGTYNFTSTQPQYPPDLTQFGSADGTEGVWAVLPDLEETLPYHRPRRYLDARTQLIEEDDASAAGSGQSLPRRGAFETRSKEEKEPKRQRKSSNIEALMERYIDMRTKLAENETTQSAKEMEIAQANDFSIKRCISILNKMDVTKEEKVKAYSVFKNLESREIFLSACDEDPESAMMWLRNEMV